MIADGSPAPDRPTDRGEGAAQATDEIAPPGPSLASRIRRSPVVEWATRHPLVVVAVVAGVEALAWAVWIWRSRHVGAFDVDEAGYLATALRIRRESGADVVDALRVATESHQAPAVPLLSQVPLWIGPFDPRTALMVQPLLIVLLCVSCAGIARRLAGPVTAILTGAFVAALPAVGEVARSYTHELAAATCTAAAIWALLASERLTNRWRWAFGLLLGLLPMTRTMAIAFVPALVAAAVVLAWGERKRVRGLVEALAVGSLLAAPWWVLRGSAALDYLLHYGYGEGAGYEGTENALGRVGFRVGRILDVSYLLTPLNGLVAATLVAAVVELRRREGRRWEGRGLGAICVAVACASMFAALVTTSNRGRGFELPVVALLVPLGAAVLARAPGRLRAVTAGVVAAVAVVVPVLHLSGPGHYENTFASHDARFAGGGADRAAAAADWAGANGAVAERVAELSGHGRVPTRFTGGSFLLNANTVLLAAQLQGWSANIITTDATYGSSIRDVAGDGPRTRDTGAEGLLVVSRALPEVLDADSDWRLVERVARSEGWEEVERIDTPGGGDVRILRPPTHR